MKQPSPKNKTRSPNLFTSTQLFPFQSNTKSLNQTILFFVRILTLKIKKLKKKKQIHQRPYQLQCLNQSTY